MPVSAEAVGVGREFVRAVGERDFATIEALLAPEAQLRALVPTRLREEEGARAIVDRFRYWWEKARELELVESEAAAAGDLVRVRYALRIDDVDEGHGVQEQSAYLAVEEGRITAISLVCTGLRSQGSP